MEKFWTVISELVSPPEYDSLEAATQEAHRRAQVFPGERFMVMEAVRTVSATLPERPAVVFSVEEARSGGERGCE